MKCYLRIFPTFFLAIFLVVFSTPSAAQVLEIVPPIAGSPAETHKERSEITITLSADRWRSELINLNDYNPSTNPSLGGACETLHDSYWSYRARAEQVNSALASGFSNLTLGLVSPDQFIESLSYTAESHAANVSQQTETGALFTSCQAISAQTYRHNGYYDSEINREERKQIFKEVVHVYEDALTGPIIERLENELGILGKNAVRHLLRLWGIDSPLEANIEKSVIDPEGQFFELLPGRQDNLNIEPDRVYLFAELEELKEQGFSVSTSLPEHFNPLSDRIDEKDIAKWLIQRLNIGWKADALDGDMTFAVDVGPNVMGGDSRHTSGVKMFGDFNVEIDWKNPHLFFGCATDDRIQSGATATLDYCNNKVEAGVFVKLEIFF